MSKDNIRFLYIAKEKYPTFRVDLTELFSNGIAKRGFMIDWHMDTFKKSIHKSPSVTGNETFYFNRVSKFNGVIAKILNRFYIFFHALSIQTLISKNEYSFIQVRDKIFEALLVIYSVKKKNIPFYYWLSFPHSEANILRSRELTRLTTLHIKTFFFIRGKISVFLLYKVILPRADFIFVQSEKMKDDLSKKGIPKEKMLPIPMGVSFEYVDQNKYKIPLNDKLNNKEVLIYVGTMVRERRIDFLIEMMPEVLKSVPNAVLLLVGDAPVRDLELLKDTISRLNLDAQVVFTGFISMEEAWGYIKNAKVGLSPFKPSEILDSTSPTKLIEYMAWKTPVVANTHPDQSSVIDSSGAGFAVEYNPSEFAKACVNILEDPDLSSAMGQKGYDYARKNRSYDRLTSLLEKEYYRLLGIVFSE